MNWNESQVIMNDLCGIFSKKLTENEMYAWHRFCLADFEIGIAEKACRYLAQNSDRFPSQAQFREAMVASKKSVQEAKEGELFAEVEPGVWVPLAQMLADQEQAKKEYSQSLAIARAEKEKRRMEQVTASIAKKI